MYIWLYYLLPTFSILAENKNKRAVLFSVVVMANLVSFLESSNGEGGVSSFQTDGRHGIWTTGGYDLIRLVLETDFSWGVVLLATVDTHAPYLTAHI